MTNTVYKPNTIKSPIDPNILRSAWEHALVLQLFDIIVTSLQQQVKELWRGFDERSKDFVAASQVVHFGEEGLRVGSRFIGCMSPRAN